MWTYLQSQTDADPCGEMWSVGAYDADGEWRAESDWGSETEARDRADLLNGHGVDAAELALIRPGHPVPDVMMGSAFGGAA